MPSVRSELVVITNAKKLSDYVFTVTQKSLKHFRMTIVNRMRNNAPDN